MWFFMFILILGVVYITYDKASEAALAQEEMNGRTIGHHPKALKVHLS